MAKESLDFNQDNQGLKDNYSPAFSKDDYEKKLTNLQFEKEMMKKKDAEREAELMRRLADDEEVNKFDNVEWTNIDYYINILKKDIEFPDSFDNIGSREIQALYGNSYKKFIMDLFYDRIQSSKDEKLKAAAFLLMNIEKWGSPYRGLERYENSWLWVKVLLGEQKYNQFLRDKQQCIDSIEIASWTERKQLQDILARIEVDYIVNDIRWLNKHLRFWFFAQDRERTFSDELVENPSKKILPSRFADRLDSLLNWQLNRSFVEKWYENIRHNDFDVSKHDFERFIKSWRNSQAFANLRKMIELVRNDKQKYECQKAFLICMLSWLLDFDGQVDMKKQVYQWGKIMWFLPWMLVKNMWHSEQVAALLDDFSNWEFSIYVKSFFHKSDLLNWEIKIRDLLKEVNGWYSPEMMHKFEKYSKWDFITKKFPSNSPLDQLQKQVLSDVTNVDNGLHS